MIGIIITGHNHFATGVYSSITMVGGQQTNVIPVDFEDGKSDEDLLNDLNKTVDSLKDCDTIVCCCDLMGGSPFKESSLISMQNPKVKVIYGVNLGMLLEFVLQKDFIEDIDQFLDQLVETGKTAIGKYQFEEYVQTESEDGI
ncbi:MAG: PTS galactosamine/N-acetylgalactosamine transporter subunit IIA [Erysipelotrichaceae bacterium]|nr:PTS galactosamine/N-acetylgalactosamine transporter subunit IIA [Erysipelotrichaceae bacterium]